MTILVMSGTRGAGKSTVANQLVREAASARLIRAVTTRPPRADDLAGSYEYTDAATFAVQSFVLCVSYGPYAYAIKDDDVLEALATHALAVVTLAPQLLPDVEKLHHLGRTITLFLDHDDAVLDRRLGERGAPFQSGANDAQRAIDRGYAHLAQLHFRADCLEDTSTAILRRLVSAGATMD